MGAIFDENDNADDAADRQRGRNDDIDLTHLSAELRDLLRQTVHRVEDIEAERKSLADDAKDLLDGAKLKGLDKKIVRKVIQRRAMDKEKREREDALLGLYEGVFR